jgi:hypothetical protein
MLADFYATLRDFIKKNSKKKNPKKIREIFFSFFFGYHGSMFNLEHASKKNLGLGPLVWEEIENEQTVHKAYKIIEGLLLNRACKTRFRPALCCKSYLKCALFILAQDALRANQGLQIEAYSCAINRAPPPTTISRETQTLNKKCLEFSPA